MSTLDRRSCTLRLTSGISTLPSGPFDSNAFRLPRIWVRADRMSLKLSLPKFLVRNLVSILLLAILHI